MKLCDEADYVPTAKHSKHAIGSLGPGLLSLLVAVAKIEDL